MKDKNEIYILVAFGDVEGPNKKISAASIFGHLFNANLWYTARQSRVLTPGARILFYQNGSGFRGHAVIDTIVEEPRSAPFGDGLYLEFSQRISLIETDTFPKAFDPRPIVATLDFISNKKYWGHAFRSTPRRISKKDFFTIIRGAAQDRDT